MQKLTFALLWIVVALVGCTGTAQNTTTEHKSTEQQAWQRIRAGALLVDVRTPEEFAKGHLEGAINIPHTKIASRTRELGKLDRNIVLYCRTGRRSGIAQEILKKLGYTNVMNAGGFEAMKAAKDKP